MAATNLVRAIQALIQWEFQELLLPFSPIYLVISGFSFGVAGIFLFFGLWTGRYWAPTMAKWGGFVYLFYLWIDRLIFRSNAGRGTNTWFIGFMSVFCLVIFFFILGRRQSREFFGISRER